MNDDTPVNPLTGRTIPELANRFPAPWDVEIYPNRVHPDFSCATIYAADSSRVCDFRGIHADKLAVLIIESVNLRLDTPVVGVGIGTARTLRRAEEDEDSDGPRDLWATVVVDPRAE